MARGQFQTQSSISSDTDTSLIAAPGSGNLVLVPTRTRHSLRPQEVVSGLWCCGGRLMWRRQGQGPCCAWKMGLAGIRCSAKGEPPLTTGPMSGMPWTAWRFMDYNSLTTPPSTRKPRPVTGPRRGSSTWPMRFAKWGNQG